MTGSQRRTQLIGVGRGLFALRGLDGTTIEEIASAAGVIAIRTRRTPVVRGSIASSASVNEPR